MSKIAIIKWIVFSGSGTLLIMLYMYKDAGAQAACSFAYSPNHRWPIFSWPWPKVISFFEGEAIADTL